MTDSIGPYLYRHTPGVFPLGQEALLLGGFAGLRRRDRVCELGCGGGAVALALLAREPGLAYTGLDRDPAAVRAARDNLAANGLSGQILSGDLRAVGALLPAGDFDLVVSNPPWFAAGSGRSGGSGRMEEACTLDDVCTAAAWLLRNGGRFALVHRPERLAALFAALAARGLEPKRLRLVQHSPSHPPSAVLLEAVRQGRPGLRAEPALILHPKEAP